MKKIWRNKLVFLFIFDSWYFVKKKIEHKKKTFAVMWALAHMLKYLKAGIKKIIEERIMAIFVSAVLFFRKNIL